MANIKKVNNQIIITLEPGHGLYAVLCVTTDNQPKLVVAEAESVEALTGALVEQGLAVAPGSLTDIPSVMQMLDGDMPLWMLDNPKQTH